MKSLCSGMIQVTLLTLILAASAMVLVGLYFTLHEVLSVISNGALVALITVLTLLFVSRVLHFIRHRLGHLPRHI
jgi:membrane protein YdbS with pleckstrin-like domain